MKKFLLLLSTAGMLVACQQTESVLDVSELQMEKTVLNGDENPTEEELRNLNLPLLYKASTVKQALDAVPFDIQFPSEFPFETEGVKPDTIEDFHHDGKKVRVTFMAYPKELNRKNPISLSFIIDNIETGEVPDADTELDNGTMAAVTNQSISFKYNGLFHQIIYLNNSIHDEERIQQMIDVANQMVR